MPMGPLPAGIAAIIEKNHCRVDHKKEGLVPAVLLLILALLPVRHQVLNPHLLTEGTEFHISNFAKIKDWTEDTRQRKF